MKQEVHLAKKIGQGFGLPSENGVFLNGFIVLNLFALLFDMLKTFGEKTPGSTRRIQDGFAKPRVYNRNHKFNHRPRRVKLTRITGRVAHLLQDAFIKKRQRVHLVRRTKMDLIYLVDDIPQKITIDHAIDSAAENGRNHVTPVALFARSFERS